MISSLCLCLMLASTFAADDAPRPGYVSGSVSGADRWRVVIEDARGAVINTTDQVDVTGTYTLQLPRGAVRVRAFAVVEPGTVVEAEPVDGEGALPGSTVQDFRLR